MPVLLRYISGPVLFIILSFAVPEFHSLRYDPLMVLGFIASILSMVAMIGGFFMPVGPVKWLARETDLLTFFRDSSNPLSRHTDDQREPKKQLSTNSNKRIPSTLETSSKL